MRKLLLSLLELSAFAFAFFVIILIRPNSPQSFFSSSAVNKVIPHTAVQASNPLPASSNSSQPKTPAPAPIVSNNTLTPTVLPPVIPAPSPPVIRQEPVTLPPPDTTKYIVISLKNQDLRYFEGTKLIGEFKISSGLRVTPTPPGDYTILAKKPFVDYKGVNYNFPHTKWNLMFKANVPLNYYIHGAYWHNNFGHPMSHGCINVSYANIEPLYNWADVGTKVSIQ
ncbi:MAG: L,D-transpeptidase [Candidatus Moraniibacteriota bacterium]